MPGFGKMKSVMLVIGLTAVFACTSALAGDAVVDTDDVVVNTNAQAIVEQQQEIRSEAAAGNGRYEDMDESIRQQLFTEQDLVFSMLDGHERSTELSAIDQTRLFNSLESISAIVNRAEDERMICERVRKTGTNRTERVCKTVAQRRAESEQSRRNVDAMQTRNGRCVTACGESRHNAADGW